MTSKYDSPFEGASDTESIISSQTDSLNRAHIYDSSNSFITPYKSSHRQKKFILEDSSDQQKQDWKTNRTKTIYYGSNNKQQIQQLQKKIIKKYPKEVENKKFHSITVKNKKSQGAKYQNVCSICLQQHSDKRALLNCGHKFCLQCIQQWIKMSTACPCCRGKFNNYVRIIIDKQKMIEIKRQQVQVQSKQMSFNQLDYLVCLQCSRGDDEDVLLICDICQFYCCHVYCDSLLRGVFPAADWYCKYCKLIMNNSQSQNRKSNLISQTQTVISSQLSNLRSNASDEEQSNSQQQEIHLNRVRTRSKAFQILNRNPSNRSNIIRQISSTRPTHTNRTNSTIYNLRTLRRRLN